MTSWRDIFPFELRPLQSKFLDDITCALISNDIVAVTAPNGFGKTICAVTIGALGYDRVYYTTRTHKQAENVIDNVRKLDAGNESVILTAIELSGKERSCINNDASGARFDGVFPACAIHKAGNKCKTGDDESTWLSIPSRGSVPVAAIPNVMDASDVNILARRLNACPYYLARSINDQHALVACSYNHVFDPVVRQSIGLDMNGALIICDECHNIIDAMESFLSREISSEKLQKAMTFPIQHTKESIGVLKDLDAMLGKANVFFKENNLESMKTRHVNTFLINSGFTKKWMLSAIKTLRGVDKGDGFLGDIISFIHVLVSDAEKDVYMFSRKEGNKKIVTMKVASMDVKPIIEDLVNEGAKILFMTGTLSFSFFKNRIGLPMATFEYMLPKRNLEAYIIDLVPGIHKRLSSYFATRDDPEIYAGFGTCIATTMPSVPGGAIAFFPSYDFRDGVIRQWETDGMISYGPSGCTFTIKDGTSIPAFIEQKDDKAKATIPAFKDATANGGKGLLLSIFRGSASEGEDFPERNCRAVFCIGMPIRNVESGEMKFKMRYLDKTKPGYGLFWMNWDAMISVSQSIGRAIRDPVKDKAIAVLVDSRYNKNSYSSLLSGWIRDCIVLQGAGVTPSKIAARAKYFLARQ
jgi:chromosome transmission fidelity protein 1